MEGGIIGPVPEDKKPERSFVVKLGDFRQKTIVEWAEFLRRAVETHRGDPASIAQTIKVTIQPKLTPSEKQSVFLRIDRAVEFLVQGAEIGLDGDELVIGPPSEEPRRYTGGGPWIPSIRETSARYFFSQ